MEQFEKNLKLYFWAELFGSISFLTPVMTLFYLHRGLQYTDLFILLIIWVVTVFFMEVPTGAFADRYGPKASFLLGHTIFLLFNILFLVAFEKWIFYIASALWGLSFTFFSGSDQAFIYETLKELNREDEMSKTWGRIHSAKFAPAVITILFGAYIARDLAEKQFILLILLGLGFNLVKLILILFMVPPKSFSRQEESHPLTHIKQGMQNLRGNTNLLLLFTNECLVMIPTYVLISDYSLAQPFFLASGLPVVFLGLVYALDSLGSYLLLNRIKWFENLFSREQLATITGIAICLAFFGGSLLPSSIITAVAVFFTVTLAFWLRYPLFAHMKNAYIPSQSRATTLSFLSMVDSLFDIVILSTLGFISTFGISRIFLGCGFIVLLGLFFPVRERRIK